MVYAKQLTMFQREKKLDELIKDAKNLKFNPSLIRNYEKQLKAVLKEIQELKDKKVKYKEDLKKEKQENEKKTN